MPTDPVLRDCQFKEDWITCMETAGHWRHNVMSESLASHTYRPYPAARAEAEPLRGSVEGSVERCAGGHDWWPAIGCTRCDARELTGITPPATFVITTTADGSPLHTPPAASPGFDEADDMCPDCQTPWKCNGPHTPPDGPSAPEGVVGV